MEEDLILFGPVDSNATLDGRRAVMSRTVWTIADQAVSSMTSLMVLVVFASRLNARDFGALSVALSISTLALGAARALATDALLVRHSDPRRPKWTRAVGSAVGTSVSVGLLASGLLLIAALMSDGTLARTYIVLAVSMPALCLQDAWRFTFFAAGKPERALVNDLVWACIFGAVLLTPWFGSAASAPGATALWVVGAVVSSGVGFSQLRSPQRSENILPIWRKRGLIRPAVAWVSQNRDLTGRFLIEFAMLSGTTQIVLFAVGAWHGLESAGAIRAAALVLGVAGVIANGIIAATVPEGARLAARPTSVRRLVLTLAVLASGGMAAWSVASRLLPDELGYRLLAARWGDATPLLVPLGLSYAGSILGTVAAAGMRALDSPRESLRAVMGLSILLLSSGMVGALFGAEAACTSMAVSAWIGGVISLIIFLRVVSLRNRAIVGVG